MIDRVRYEIEVSMPLNGSLLFSPAAKVLRGAWSNGEASRFEVGRSLRTMSYEVGDLPGIHIFADLAAGKFGYFDPLEDDPAYATVAKKLKDFMKKAEFGTGKEITFTEKQISDVKTPSDMKDWLHWMRQAYDADCAKIATGFPPLPSIEDIRKMPGSRRLHGNGLVDKESREAVESLHYHVDDSDDSIFSSTIVTEPKTKRSNS